MNAVQGPQCRKTVKVSRFDQTIYMRVSPISETLTAPWGTVNGVALDNNSCQALPLPLPVPLLQAEQEDEKRGHEEEEEKSNGAVASFRIFKVS